MQTAFSLELTYHVLPLHSCTCSSHIRLPTSNGLNWALLTISNKRLNLTRIPGRVCFIKKSQHRTTLLNIQVSTNTSSTIYRILGISPSSFSHLTFKEICVPKKRISINLLLNSIKWVFFFPITRECPLLQPCKMTFCPSKAQWLKVPFWTLLT